MPYPQRDLPSSPSSFLFLLREKPWDIYNLQSRQVKRTPQNSTTELIIWKMNLSVVPMTTVKFKSAFQHAWWAVNILWELLCIWSDWKSLKLLIKLLQRHSHQIQGNWAGKNFITASRVNSWLIMYARMQRWIWNLQLPTVSTFEYSWISRKRSPKMQRLTDCLWEVVADKNWTTGDLFREEVWARLLYGR